MIRRVPVLPTLIVLIAVGIMIGLGFWQLGRLHQKEAELAQLAANLQSPAAAFPDDRFDQSFLFRRAILDCRAPKNFTTEGAGKAGYRIIATCSSGAQVQLGTTNDLRARVSWGGGLVEGSIGQVPDSRPLLVTASDHTPRELMLIAGEPVAGLAANPPRSLAEIPNNHLSYAVQWFLFAGIALVIYALALRKRLKG